MKGLRRDQIHRVQGPGVSALCLVTDFDDDTVGVTLLSNEVEFASPADLIVHANDGSPGRVGDFRHTVPGRTYALLVHGNVFGYVPRDRLIHHLGDMPGVSECLHVLRNDEEPARFPPGVPIFGPPILDANDPRWAWGISELKRMRQLES